MKLKHNKLLPNFACFGFNSNLRPCFENEAEGADYLNQTSEVKLSRAIDIGDDDEVGRRSFTPASPQRYPRLTQG